MFIHSTGMAAIPLRKLFMICWVNSVFAYSALGVLTAFHIRRMHLLANAATDFYRRHVRACLCVHMNAWICVCL